MVAIRLSVFPPLASKLQASAIQSTVHFTLVPKARLMDDCKYQSNYIQRTLCTERPTHFSPVLYFQQKPVQTESYGAMWAAAVRAPPVLGPPKAQVTLPSSHLVLHTPRFSAHTACLLCSLLWWCQPQAGTRSSLSRCQLLTALSHF